LSYFGAEAKIEAIFLNLLFILLVLLTSWVGLVVYYFFAKGMSDGFHQSNKSE
jgi:phage shock protein PspC (stress-responsive transcriptional regulator)